MAYEFLSLLIEQDMQGIIVILGVIVFLLFFIIVFNFKSTSSTTSPSPKSDHGQTLVSTGEKNPNPSLKSHSSPPKEPNLHRVWSDKGDGGSGEETEAEAETEGTDKTDKKESAYPAGKESKTLPGGEESTSEDVAKIQSLEKEILEKDQMIADLHKQMTQSGSESSSPSMELAQENEDLKKRLKEYAIIEEDIADLSLYKAQNQELKKQLEELQKSSSLPGSPLPPDQDLSANPLPPKENSLNSDSVPQNIEEKAEISSPPKEIPKDRNLVSEFEKMVYEQSPFRDTKDLDHGEKMVPPPSSSKENQEEQHQKTDVKLKASGKLDASKKK